jgi:hypothetical protein
LAAAISVMPALAGSLISRSWKGAEHPLRAASRFRRIGRDMLDSQALQRPADLGELFLVDRTVRLRRVEIMAAAIGVEARCRPVNGEHFEQRRKRRSGAFLFDQERRGRIVHRHDQVDSTPASHRLNRSRNFCILRSASHAVRFIESPPKER